MPVSAAPRDSPRRESHCLGRVSYAVEKERGRDEREREREREGEERPRHSHLLLFYIYIYIYVREERELSINTDDQLQARIHDSRDFDFVAFIDRLIFS